MKSKTIEFNISPEYTTALAYGDYSGLTEEDEVLINDFLEYLPTIFNCENGNFCFEYGEEEYDNWTQCDISGLDSDCVTLKVTIFIN